MNPAPWPFQIAYLAAALCALVLSLLFCRLFCHQAEILGLVDRPKNEAHKNHMRATPVAGGSAMLCSWLLTVGGGVTAVCLLSMTSLTEKIPMLTGLRLGFASVAGTLGCIVGCAALLTAVGIADDRKPMKAGRKFICQFIVAAITATFGPRISVCCPIPAVTWLLTVFWIVTVINALNFFDNMDGLAGGTAAIAAFFFLLISAIRGQYLVSALAAVTTGCALGFLWYNKPPARTFMGDGGSHFLGYTLAVLSILTTFYLPSDSPTASPLLIPLLVLGLPLFDAVAVVLIRLKLHKPIYIGDNRHISHRFVQLGLSRPQAVLVICLLSIITGAGALNLLWLPPAGVILVFGQFAALMITITMIQFFVHRTE